MMTKLNLTLATLALSACGTSEAPPSPEASADGCVATALAADAVVVAGVGAPDGPPSWPALPDTAVVASTYLRLQSSGESLQTFDQLSGAVIEELFRSPGMLGVSLTASMACNTSRTLTVWQTRADMFRFVASGAHVAAIGRVAEVSRGGSITETWPASDLPSLDWADVVPRFAEHDGTVY